MAIKYAENYVTVRWQRQDYASIAARYEGLVAVGDVTRVPEQKLLEVEQHLAAAHEHYFSCRYLKAIDEYKLAQGLIYKLLTPSFTLEIATQPGVKIPIAIQQFDALLNVSLEIVEALPIPPKGCDFGPFQVDSGVDPLRDLGALGLQIADGLPDAVKVDNELAVSYAGRLQWERSIFFYQRAQSSLTGVPGAVAEHARASLSLNLAGVFIQSGQVREAQAQLQKALEGYRKTQDLVGQAQVSYNLAALAAREGAADQSTLHLKRGDELLNQAQGLTATGNTTTPSRTGPVAGLNAGAIIGGSGRPTVGTSEGSRLHFGTGLRPLSRSMSAASSSLTRVSVGASAALTAASAREMSAANAFSTRPDALETLSSHGGAAITYRQPVRGAGWTAQETETRIEAAERTFNKSLGTRLGGGLARVEWKAGTKVPTQTVTSSIYEWRIDRTKLSEINWFYSVDSDLALQLPHLFYYVIPVALGDCYHAIGEYDTAEGYYLKAADYPYINLSAEVPALWRRLAQNALSWGDAWYKDEAFTEAVAVYRKVLEPPGITPVVWADSHTR